MNPVNTLPPSSFGFYSAMSFLKPPVCRKKGHIEASFVVPMFAHKEH
jgi:hypothetical protein